MLGLLGLRIFEASGSDIEDLGEEHGHRVLRVRGQPIGVALSGSEPVVDPGGSEDRGNIDRFEFDERLSKWVIDGAWGSVLMSDPMVTLRFE